MQIGEFAKICNTKISVLRHYESKGLLVPDYVDRFTGYRYYTKEQISVFSKIIALKNAGFSLSEIHQVIVRSQNDEEILDILERKQKLLEQSLYHLIQAKQMLIGGNTMTTISYSDSENRTIASIPMQDCCSFDELCEQMENELSSQGYQRISTYYWSENSVCCEVLKLSDNLRTLHDPVDVPFEPDDRVIGKWEVIGEYSVKEDFLQNRFCNPDFEENPPREIYFLPNGERYWGYGWTKGILLIDDGISTSQNPYILEQHDGEEYLFITFKSYNYRRGGKESILVLKNLDHNPYCADNLKRKDNLDFSFISDEQLIGSWSAHSFCQTKEQFDPKRTMQNLYWSEVTFLPNGSCTSIYGDDIISGDKKQTWTKGHLLRKFNHCDCAYEIRTIDGVDYLIIEWKSGDYRFGGFKTDYYVFTRK